MNQVEVWIDDETLGGSSLVGRLTKAPSKTGDTVSFEYDVQWLSGVGPVPPFPLDPELVLAAGVHYSRQGANALTGELAPAFDVNPNPDKDHHVLAIDGDDPSPDSGRLLAVADYYRVTGKEVGRVVEQVRAAVRGWEERARALGAQRSEIASMRAVIDAER
jgi:hypothetical protein